MTELHRQAALLKSLSTLEKAQPSGLIICSAITFQGDTVKLHGEIDVYVPLEAEPSEILLDLASCVREPLAEPHSGVEAAYPSEMDVAAVWAELHYDLTRVGYLEALDSSIRYETIRLCGGQARVTLSKFDPLRSVRVETDLLVSMNAFPVHTADELGEAILGV